MLFKEIVDARTHARTHGRTHGRWRTDNGPSQNLTLSTLCSGELKRLLPSCKSVKLLQCFTIRDNNISHIVFDKINQINLLIVIAILHCINVTQFLNFDKTQVFSITYYIVCKLKTLRTFLLSFCQRVYLIS